MARITSQGSQAVATVIQMRQSADALAGKLGATGRAAELAAGSISAATASIDASGGAMAETLAGTGESVAQVTEQIRLNTEQILANKAAAEEYAASVDKTGAASLGASRNVQRLGIMSGRLLGSISGAPTVIQRTVSSIGAMTMGMGAATAGAAGLTAALTAIVPIASLAVGAVFGVVKIVEHFGGASQRRIDELNAKIDEMSGRYSTLTGELLGMYEQLARNNELIDDMNRLGANSAFVERLEDENTALDRQIRLRQIMANMAAEKTTQATLELMDEGKYLTGRYATLGGLQTTAGEKSDILSAINSLTDMYATGQENFVVDWNPNHMGSGTTHNIRDTLYGYMEELRTMRENIYGGTDEGAAALAAIDDVIDRYNSIFSQYDFSPIPPSAADEAKEEAARRLEQQEAALKLSQQAAERTARIAAYEMGKYKNSVIDLATELDNLETAHGALQSAVAAMNGEADMELEAFYALMSLSPEYIATLYSQTDGVLDLAAATDMLIAAKMEEMAVSKALEIIDAAKKYQEAYGTIVGYAAGIDIATDSMWGLVEAQIESIRLSELAKVPHDLEKAERVNEALSPIIAQIEMLKASAASTQRSVAQYPDQIKRVNKVDEIGKPVKLADEDLRLLADMAERKYMTEVNLQTLAPNVTVNVSNRNGEVLDEARIASAVGLILTEQIAAHSNTVYE
jgi:hypothetical protein